MSRPCVSLITGVVLRVTPRVVQDHGDKLFNAVHRRTGYPWQHVMHVTFWIQSQHSPIMLKQNGSCNISNNIHIEKSVINTPPLLLSLTPPTSLFILSDVVVGEPPLVQLHYGAVVLLSEQQLKVPVHLFGIFDALGEQEWTFNGLCRERERERERERDKLTLARAPPANSLSSLRKVTTADVFRCDSL